ncbi:guanine-hypoxanthine permease [Striga asiatica]|uniref:Guanine-hypoxanthine permease n=1 Tax=Striga asiatica TaxID=4170 RepID=A0A5A7QRN4_STRAF|nr:guanine-hypoxanthine permease [Striga asiatica]
MIQFRRFVKLARKIITPDSIPSSDHYEIFIRPAASHRPQVEGHNVSILRLLFYSQNRNHIRQDKMIIYLKVGIRDSIKSSNLDSTDGSSYGSNPPISSKILTTRDIRGLCSGVKSTQAIAICNTLTIVSSSFSPISISTGSNKSVLRSLRIINRAQSTRDMAWPLSRHSSTTTPKLYTSDDWETVLVSVSFHSPTSETRPYFCVLRKMFEDFTFPCTSIPPSCLCMYSRPLAAPSTILSLVSKSNVVLSLPLLAFRVEVRLQFSDIIVPHSSNYLQMFFEYLERDHHIPQPLNHNRLSIVNSSRTISDVNTGLSREKFEQQNPEAVHVRCLGHQRAFGMNFVSIISVTPRSDTKPYPCELRNILDAVILPCTSFPPFFRCISATPLAVPTAIFIRVSQLTKD